MADSRINFLKGLYPTPTEHAKQVGLIFQCLAGDDTQRGKFALSIITDYKLSPTAIIQVACANKNALELFSENEILTNYWKEKFKKEELKEEKCYVMDIQPMKKEYPVITIFEQYAADDVMRPTIKTNENGSEQILDDALLTDKRLDIACNMGYFPAITKRCQNAIESKDSSLDKLLKNFLKDTDDLGRLYWQLGYIHAGYFLLMMSGALTERKDIDNGKRYLAKAAEKLLCAADDRLRKNSYSKEIIQCLSQNQGIEKFFKGGGQLKIDWEKDENLMNTIKTSFNDMLSSFDFGESEKNAKKEIESFLTKKIESDTSYAKAPHIFNNPSTGQKNQEHENELSNQNSTKITGNNSKY